MKNKPDYKLLAADILARVLVYGPLAAAAVMFAPTSLIVVGLAAAQPWFGEGLGMAATWMEKKFPRVMAPIDKLLARYAGMQWWKHAGVLITALAVAIVPTPAIAAHLPHLIQAGLRLLGGPDQTWTGIVLPFALATALPYATNLATKGFEWVFQKIPALRDATVRRQEARELRRLERETIRLGVHRPEAEAPAGPSMDAASAPAVSAPATPPVVAGSAPAPGLPGTAATAPQPVRPAGLAEGSVPADSATRSTRIPAAVVTPVTRAAAALRRVVAPVQQRVIRDRSRSMPGVLHIPGRPRRDVPGARPPFGIGL